MEQDPNFGGQNQNFWANYGAYLVIGLIIIVAIIFFATRPDNDSEQGSDDQTSEQQMTENNDTMDPDEASMEENKSNDQNQTTTDQTTTPQSQGNVTATGTLQPSDNTTKGNLMIASNQGPIYIVTSRDYSSLLNQTVTLAASGTINNFRVIEIAAAGQAQPEQPSQETANQTFMVTGTLQNNNNTPGHYTIHSDSGVITLKTKHDYTAWVGQTVHLSATGTINSFYNAVLTQ